LESRTHPCGRRHDQPLGGATDHPQASFARNAEFYSAVPQTFSLHQWVSSSNVTF
jgi:hypothetical protein